MENHIPALGAKEIMNQTISYFEKKKAPKINATTINICEVGTTNEIPARTKLTTTTKIDNNLYSAFKNANAPSYI